MKKTIFLIMTIFISILSFSDSDVRTFSSVDRAAVEYADILGSVINGNAKDLYVDINKDITAAISTMNDMALKTKWEEANETFFSQYEFKIVDKKNVSANKVEVEYELYGYDEKKIDDFLEDLSKTIIKKNSVGEVEFDIVKYVDGFSNYLKKTGKEPLKNLVITFEKTGEKWKIED